MTEVLPEWEVKRKRREIRTSASQFETFELCRRKWWLNKVRKLDQPKTKSLGFGTVLHAVVERWMNASDTGYDSKGNPVDLYPQGWHHAMDDTTQLPEYTCTPAEQDIIKKLIETAIEQGVLERLPGRQIEREFRRTILQIPCPDCGGGGTKMIHRPDVGAKTFVADGKCETCNGDGKGTTITILGYIDVELPDGIQDHKTTSNMRYAKSANKLRINTQILIYAKQHLLHMEERGEPLPPKLTVRHNVFCKKPDALKVRKTYVDVTIDEINKKWQDVLTMSVDMDALRRGTNRWDEISPPVNMTTACNAYGGCPYMSICTGAESMNMYEKRLASNGISSNTSKGKIKPFEAQVTPLAQTKGSTMDFNAALAQKAAMQEVAAGGAPAAAPAINPAVPAAAVPVATPVAVAAPAAAEVPAPAPVVAVAAAVPAPSNGAPPWADPNCKACKAGGFNTKGIPCRICDMSATARGVPQSSAFLLTADGQGNIYWQNNENDQHSGLSPLPVQTAPVAAQVATDPVPAPAPVVEAAPAPAPVVETPAVEAAPVAAPAAAAAPAAEAAPAAAAAPDKGTVKSAGRPKKGFILCINCSPVKGQLRSGSGRSVIQLSEVMHAYGAQMAATAGAASFYALDAFARRDALAAAAEAISEEFGTDMVVGYTDSPDMKAFIGAMRPLAGMEIVGGV